MNHIVTIQKSLNLVIIDSEIYENMRNHVLNMTSIINELNSERNTKVNLLYSKVHDFLKLSGYPFEISPIAEPDAGMRVWHGFKISHDGVELLKFLEIET